METKKHRPAGSIKVSDAVILKIAEVAATEIEGVDSVGQKLVCPDTKPNMFGAVRAKLNGDSTELAMDMIVLEGYNAVSVAESVQKSVKSAVQSMTGFTVTRVDVNIVGIKLNRASE